MIFDFNMGVQSYWEPALWANAFRNYETIRREYKSGARWFDGLPNVEKSAPALILGSGLSLDSVLRMIPYWQGAIFAGPSNAHQLDKIGAPPQYLCCIDSSESQFTKIKDVEWYVTTLLTTPMVEQKLIEWWTWEKRYFLPVDLNTSFFTNVIPSVYPWIRPRVVNSGCVANAMMVIADSLGYDPIFTVGVDFGFKAGQDGVPRERATDFKYRAPGVYEFSFSDPIDPAGRTRTGDPYMVENGVVTTRTNLFYKFIAMANWKMLKCRWYDCSDGIISEVPKIDFREVLQNQVAKNGKIKIKNLPTYPTHKQIDKIVDDYTIPMGGYLQGSGEPGSSMGIEFGEYMVDGLREARNKALYYKEMSELWSITPDGNWARKHRDVVVPDREAIAAAVERSIESERPGEKEILDSLAEAKARESQRSDIPATGERGDSQEGTASPDDTEQPGESTKEIPFPRPESPQEPKGG